MMNCLKPSTSLTKRTPYLRRKFMSFKKNLMKSMKIFQKLKLQNYLENKNEELLKKNEWLVSSLSKFSCGQKAFEMIMASHKCVFDKMGLGYKSSKNEKYFKNYFVKESTSESPSTICNFCDKGGHISSTCPLKNGSQKVSTSKSNKA